MRGHIITEAVTLVTEDCCVCGILFAMPEDFRDMLTRKTNKLFYCPNGHSQHYMGLTYEEKLRRAEARATHFADQRDAAERSARAYKGQATKAKKKLERVEAGVCPECKRSFQNLRRHMENQHDGIHV